MWPFRTPAAQRRARRLRKLRAAQARGAACVTCGRRSPLPTIPTRVNTPDGSLIGGYACQTCRPVLALPSGGTS